ncbi:MAG: hypothetical protein ACYDEZ_06955, partial [Methanoregula sp.]
SLKHGIIVTILLFSTVIVANQTPAGTAMFNASRAAMPVSPTQNQVRSSAGSSLPTRIPRYRNP